MSSDEQLEIRKRVISLKAKRRSRSHWEIKEVAMDGRSIAKRAGRYTAPNTNVVMII